MNEERDDNEDDEEAEAGGGAENRAQAKGIELSASKQSRTQKTSEKIVDERRVFTIPKSLVLRRSPIVGVSRIDSK